MAEQNNTNKEAKLFLGRYQVLSEIGHGGMGRVYKVKDIRLDRIVALKVLLKSLTMNEENLQRFMREAKSNAALRHPNIVTLYDSDKVKETVFLTMDFIEGGSLEDLLKKGRPSFDLSCRILLKLLDAIGFAHSKNIIHRDIKPSNILLQGEEPFVTDFGLAKAIHDSINLSQSGAILGTPCYMAPEQAQGDKENPVNHQSDIYSLGATFYQMLTEKLPIEGETVFQIMYKLASEEAPKPHKVCPDVPLALSQICTKALQKDKKNRYQTTQEMAQDIREYLEGSPREDKALPEKISFDKTQQRKPSAGQKTTLVDNGKGSLVSERPLKVKNLKTRERKKALPASNPINYKIWLALCAVVCILLFMVIKNQKNISNNQEQQHIASQENINPNIQQEPVKPPVEEKKPPEIQQEPVKPPVEEKKPPEIQQEPVKPPVEEKKPTEIHQEPVRPPDWPEKKDFTEIHHPEKHPLQKTEDASVDHPQPRPIHPHDREIEKKAIKEFLREEDEIRPAKIILGLCKLRQVSKKFKTYDRNGNRLLDQKEIESIKNDKKFTEILENMKMPRMVRRAVQKLIENFSDFNFLALDGNGDQNIDQNEIHRFIEVFEDMIIF